MNKFLSHLKDFCYDQETGLRKRIVFSIATIIIGLSIMIWILIRLLCFEGYWNTNANIDLTSSGQIGDFVGGLSGTLFTLVGVILLFETLALQRKELVESRNVFEKQQFENTFFNLLTLYQEIVKSLQYEEEIYESLPSNGKDYFKRNKQDFINDFVPQIGIEKNRKAAKNFYTNFYSANKEQVAHYFRTLYRIFRFIKSSNFKDAEKITYSKIVRAQLSESELFFLHYNAFTEYGTKFRELINFFNITKHLPTLEKVEFKNYRIQLSNEERNSLELVFDDIKMFISNSLKEGKDFHKTYLKGSVSIKVSSTGNNSFMLSVIKKENIIIGNNPQQGFGLRNFTNQELELFFKDYLTDLLSYSNYYEFNKRNLRITSILREIVPNDKYIIEISAANIKGDQIKFN